MSTRAVRRILLVTGAFALTTCTMTACTSATPRTAATTRSPTSASTSTTTARSTTTTAGAAPTAPSTSTTAAHPDPTTPPTTTAPAFSGTITVVTAADVASTYRAGCPVGPSALRMLHMSYWGFDGRTHAGSIVVNAAVAEPVVTVFANLFRAHFPIRRMQPVDAYGGSDPASMAADNTSGFNCRNAVAAGPPRWSAHAYGEAIDVNPVENPYVEGGTVQPPAGAAFLDRSSLRPGMTAPGTAVNTAFAAIGWPWGGHFNDPDYQHFSKTGG